MITLDPREPFLADHRPNGRPLLGTVASLEIMASALDLVPQRIEAVDIVTPVIFSTDAPLAVRVLREADEYVLASDTPRHIACRFPDGAPDGQPRRFAEFPGPRAVETAEIYRLFFHGPAFRVVAAAEWRDGVLLARMNTGLPPWHRDGKATLTAPQLLEFALQSAGLLALAERPTMEIPRYIARIEHYPPAGEELFARAEYGADGIDIDLFDQDGFVHLRVTGYRTTALPYPARQDRMEALHRALRR